LSTPSDKIGLESAGYATLSLGIRPRTLSLAAVPVAVGAALAWSRGAGFGGWVFVVTLACAVLIQVGTNLFNDAGDGLRGADGPDRLGPKRLTGAGLVPASQVRRAAICSFVLALVAGAYLVYVGGLAILAIGIASLLAGYFYSSGPKPLSHGPWGEIFVIVFFGIAAVAGSYYLQMDQAPDLAVLVTGVALGGPAAAVLLVNNVRDLDADVRAGRRTLARRLGLPAAGLLYAVLMLVPFPLLLAALGWSHAALAMLPLPFALWLVFCFRSMAVGPVMNDQLFRTALVQAAVGLLLVIGLLV